MQEYVVQDYHHTKDSDSEGSADNNVSLYNSNGITTGNDGTDEEHGSRINSDHEHSDSDTL